MPPLEGSDAYRAVSRLLGGAEIDAAWTAASPAIERLRRALTEDPRRASDKDLAVLVRQVLRRETVLRDNEMPPSLPCAHPRLSGFDQWDAIGCEVIRSAAGIRIEALPWSPDWLCGAGQASVDAYAASEVVRRTFNGAEAAGDPFLASLGRTSYRSLGQRAAVRAALSTPEGGTLVVALPTGEGKSLIFQLAHRIGFVGAPNSDGPGLTLVIVPTVALGLNHEQEAVDICGLSRPLTFQGAAHAENAVIAANIRDGTQGLCFASPEAACGTLREPLRQAAEAGRLRAIVVDEAHLIDQWGTGFRTEFQELSGLRRELIAASPPGRRLRTLLLSATLTDSSLETLRALFGTDGAFESVAAVKLRPEPDYWVAPESNDAERVERVLAALHHIPRPAALYVTKVVDAIAWHARLKDAGFSRLGLVHGKTSQQNRDSVVAGWRTGALDLVVGTSAFGLGIDYAHARSVIHACVPETLDRFYQEVGRGGRDGCGALSLIIPAGSDKHLARRMTTQKMIGVDRALVRWRTMFEGKANLAGDRFAVRIDGRPSSGEADIDMKGDRNTDWNLRTLALMARAGLIHLHGSPWPKLEHVGDWVEVETLDERHLEAEVWDEKVEGVRQDSRQATRRTHDLMNRFLEDQTCPADILEDLYGADRVSRDCSRCSQCRTDQRCRRPAASVGEPISPWTATLDPIITRLCDSSLRLLVTYDRDTLTRAASRRFGESLARMNKAGLSKLLVLGQPGFDLAKALEFAKTAPFFVSYLERLAYSRLPPGPEVVLVGAGQTLVEANLVARAMSPRILIADRDQVSPDGRLLRMVFGGRTLTLEEFNSRLAE